MPPSAADIAALVRRLRNSDNPREQAAAIAALQDAALAAEPAADRTQSCQTIAEAAAPELVACDESGNAFTQMPAAVLLCNVTRGGPSASGGRFARHAARAAAQPR